MHGKKSTIDRLPLVGKWRAIEPDLAVPSLGAIIPPMPAIAVF
jgi:hypothetical protein